MRKVLLVSSVVVSILGVVAGMTLNGLEGNDLLWPLMSGVWAPVGALILWKRPGNGVGRALLAIGLAWGVSFLLFAFAFRAPAPIQARVWAEMFNTMFGAIPWVGIIWLLLVFPSGRLEGRLERAGGVLLAVLTAVAAVSFAIAPAPMEATGRPSPLAQDWMGGATGEFVGDGGFFIVLFVIVLAIVALARRWRASTGAERHQYRWLVLGALVFTGTLVIGQFLPEDSSALYVWIVAGAAIPISVGVAVTRYRLFEIDRLLSRTVTYALVAGLLASLFALVAVGLPNWIPGVDDSPLLVAAATLGVAGLFDPLRRRVQAAVDRRFNRSHYDAETVMDEFAGRLRDQLDAVGIADGWARVVSVTMEPTSVGIWVRS